MSKVIVLASGKGGTGKSSVCVGLAISLAKRNNNVLLIDCDCGMRGLDLLLGIEDELVFDASDIVKGSCNYSAAVYKQQAIAGLYLLPAPFESEDEISPGVMKQLVFELKPHYDYVLIDSPAGVGSPFVAAAVAADTALAVVNTEPAGMRGCENITKKLRAIGIPNIRLVINRLNVSEFVSCGVYRDLDEVIDISGLQLLGVVPEDYEFAKMLHHGCAKYNVTAASSAFDRMVARLEGETVPIPLKL